MLTPDVIDVVRMYATRPKLKNSSLSPTNSNKNPLENTFLGVQNWLEAARWRAQTPPDGLK